MSLKNDRWIDFMAKKHGMIEPFVDRCVAEGIVSYGLSSFGYDMRAGTEWQLFSDLLGAVVDPKHMDPTAFARVDAEEGSYIILPPNSYALTHSVEYFKIPPNVTALCIGKSTYARCGVHVNITPLEAGWEGQVTIEISNGTRLPVRIYAGEGIAQVLFFEGEEPLVSYADRKGKYQGQRGVVMAKVKPAESAEVHDIAGKPAKSAPAKRR